MQGKRLIVVLLVRTGYNSVFGAVGLGIELTQKIDLVGETLYARVCAVLNHVDYVVLEVLFQTFGARWKM